MGRSAVFETFIHVRHMLKQYKKLYGDTQNIFGILPQSGYILFQEVTCWCFHHIPARVLFFGGYLLGIKLYHLKVFVGSCELFPKSSQTTSTRRSLVFCQPSIVVTFCARWKTGDCFHRPGGVTRILVWTNSFTSQDLHFHAACSSSNFRCASDGPSHRREQMPRTQWPPSYSIRRHGSIHAAFAILFQLHWAAVHCTAQWSRSASGLAPEYVNISL